MDTQEKGYKTVIDNIEVFPNGDADLIGNHFKNLEIANHAKIYEQLGENVEVNYKKKKMPNGNTKVRVIVNHK